jgi:hypothetical protein
MHVVEVTVETNLHMLQRRIDESTPERTQYRSNHNNIGGQEVVRNRDRNYDRRSGPPHTQEIKSSENK